MKQMKVLFQSRKDLFEAPGGDTTQIINTKKALEKLGYDIDIDCSVDKKLSDYDLVHIFNLRTINWTKKQVDNAKRQNKKIVLSTIWWDLKKLGEDSDFRKYANRKKRWISLLISVFKGFNVMKAYLWLDKVRFDLKVRKSAVHILRNVDFILPNSIAELEILISDFNMPELRAKAYPVVNAIDIKTDTGNIKRVKDNEFPEDYILCVGRIEPLKGQAKVIKALDKNNIPLVFIGRVGNVKYNEYVKKLAKGRGNTYFISQVEHNQLIKYYKQAKVHVLPSLSESTGLVSLEAAINKVNIVISYQAPVQEYFGDNAYVCDPLSIEDIRDNIMKAYKAKYDDKLRQSIAEKLTWDKAAEQTSVVYEKVNGGF